jgi:hydrogenase expression/formation protein HypE
VGIEIDERRIAVREEVKSACELLGFDPLYVANEGKLVAIVESAAADALLQAMRSHPLGEDAQIIGVVTTDHVGLVTMRTLFGASRIVDMLPGDLLPRIC